MKSFVCILIFACSMFLLPSQTAQAATDTIKTTMSANEVKLRAYFDNLFTQCLDRQRTLALKTLNIDNDTKNEAMANDADEAMVDITETLDEIGSVFKAYYGENTGGQITRQLKQYYQMSADYAEVLREHNDTAVTARIMHDKANELSGLFNSFGTVWLNSGLSEVLTEYSDLLAEEIEIQNESFGKPDPNIPSITSEKSSEIAGIFAAGIARQFPERFK